MYSCRKNYRCWGHYSYDIFLSRYGEESQAKAARLLGNFPGRGVEIKLQEDEMYDGELERTGDGRNVAKVLRNALREADACAVYALDAEEAGNERLADFFREVQETHTMVAGRAEEMLGGRGGEERAGVVGRDSVPAEGDPGDVSPGQDRVI